jgi:hypothetical protein
MQFGIRNTGTLNGQTVRKDSLIFSFLALTPMAFTADAYFNK